MRLYLHPRWTNCKKVLNALQEQGASFTTFDLTTQVPEESELRSAIEQHGIKKVFNSSGQKYREQKLKDKINELSPEQAIKLLRSDGMLIKRPFVVDGDRVSIGSKSF